MADGETVDVCAAATLEATVAAIATLLEQGDKPPAPGKRDQQVNIRLTADERFQLEEAAQRAGFRSVSDYVRAAALGEASRTNGR